MPGFTHLQAAQPVTLGHHLLAYVEMFGRDRGRFADARVRLNECPLGAAALAGTSFPIDRDRDRRGARVRRAHGELDRCRVGPRLRARVPGRRGDRGDAPVAPRRRAGAVVDAAVRLRQDGRGVLERQLDHAAEAQPRRRGAGARQGGARDRRSRRAAGRAQGPAARLRQGPAGGQGAGVRCGRQSRPLPGGDGRYD